MSQTQATNVLLTGVPGCGKTTVVRRVIELLGHLRLAGFYTEEIRRHGQRVGFEAIGLGGARTVLAHVDFRTKHRVGRYGVDVEGFESLVQKELQPGARQVDLVVIDEIGKMECLSRAFIEAATRVLDGPVPVLAAIAAKGGGFIREVRTRPDVGIITVTAQNRDELPTTLALRMGHRIE